MGEGLFESSDGEGRAKDRFGGGGFHKVKVRSEAVFDVLVQGLMLSVFNTDRAVYTTPFPLLPFNCIK